MKILYPKSFKEGRSINLFPELLSGGTKSPRHHFENANCMQWEPQENEQTGAFNDEKLGIHAHSSGQGGGLSQEVPEQIAIRLAQLYGQNKTKLKDLYLISCEAGIYLDDRPATAQLLAIELRKLGFGEVRVHAVANPTDSPSDNQNFSIRVKTIDQPGTKMVKEDHVRVEAGLIARIAQADDVCAFTVKRTMIQGKSEETQVDLLIPPTAAGSFQRFWDLPHNTFSSTGPIQRATLLQIQVENRLLQAKIVMAQFI